MIYLIGQLSIWLVLTAAFAAIAGWAFAAQRSSNAERSLRRDRENLMRDLVRLAGEDTGAGASVAVGERETDSLRRLLELRDVRITELEQATEAARARADDAASELAEAQRQLAQGSAAADASVHTIEIAPEPAPEATPLIDEETLALQTWRLRYFEQRVQYLEGLSRATAAPLPDSAETLPLEWRARDAEARVAFLEEELRKVNDRAPAIVEAEPEELLPFAADADVDVLLRWRLLYLERRTAHLQAQVAEQSQANQLIASAPPAPSVATAPDPDRWKWRARYLEARVRHLEQHTAASAPQAAPQPLSAEIEAPSALEPAHTPQSPPAMRPRGAKPPVLAAARNGAPDDFTLIDGVSLMQQSTLYALGVFHFDQVAAWTPEHVAWIDQYLRLQGRIEDDEWVEQAAELARDGPSAARRMLEGEGV